MFDAGFTELLLIGVLALLVVGPERLPKLARSAGILLGKAQRMFQDVKQEVSQELAAEELKKSLENQANASKNEMFDILEETKAELEPLSNNSLEKELQSALGGDTEKPSGDGEKPAAVSKSDNG